jgi:hypothetical protein
MELVEAHTVDIVRRLDEYNKKLNRSFLEDWDVKKYPFVFLLEDGSICAYGMGLNYIDVGPTSGEFKPMLKKIKELARYCGVPKLITTTPRNPDAYAKLSGAKLTGALVHPDGYAEYYFEMEV